MDRQFETIKVFPYIDIIPVHASPYKYLEPTQRLMKRLIYVAVSMPTGLISGKLCKCAQNLEFISRHPGFTYWAHSHWSCYLLQRIDSSSSVFISTLFSVQLLWRCKVISLAKQLFKSSFMSVAFVEKELSFKMDNTEAGLQFLLLDTLSYYKSSIRYRGSLPGSTRSPNHFGSTQKIPCNGSIHQEMFRQGEKK